MKSAPLDEMTAFLDDYLDVASVADWSNALNGLQVENGGTVGRIVAAVDASQATIDGAVAGGQPAPLVLVHHGLFWDGHIPVTGRRYRRIAALLSHDMALYSAHLPLDLHPEVGNNVELARVLEIPVGGWFGEHRGRPIGVWGDAERDRDEVVARLNQALDTDARLIAGGPPRSRRIGIISGGAGDMIAAAARIGCDTFVTGEGAHHTFFDARELGVNVIYAGHYATEKLGVQALARVVSERFGVPWEFHDHPTGL